MKGNQQKQINAEKPNSLKPFSSFARRRRPTPTKAFNTYWRFAAERQKVFMARVHGNSHPWTSDQILQNHKFTNAYRASDRVSQYLIKHVIYSEVISERDVLFRTLLFKLFNKIDTWKLLEEQLGPIHLATFSPDRFGSILNKALNSGGKIYNAAYIMPSGPKKKYKGKRKHEFHLQLLENLFKTSFPEKIIESRSMAEAFSRLLQVETFGNFLAYQFITDINYSDIVNFSELEFVVPGPGALDGIRKCFSDIGEYAPADVIRMMADEQKEHFSRLNIDFPSLWGRDLQLIDCQNLFCETDKYARIAHPEISGVSGRTKIKQKFFSQSAVPTPWYPPKWGLNDRIQTNQK
jgi:hypothetical protein